MSYISNINNLNLFLSIIISNLEPENILLDREGHLRLTDFDRAQKIESQKPVQSMQNIKDNTLPSVVINEVSNEVMMDYWKLVNNLLKIFIDYFFSGIFYL